MKKLKLSLSNMEGVEVLTREQLKKVMGGEDGGSGGDGGGSGGCTCVTNSDCVSAKCGDTCRNNGRKNICYYNPFG